MKSRRINSIDFARGLVMIIMALDHSRDLLYAGTTDPTDLTTTTPALFFTRWITHLCAPAFVFLSGVSAWLSVQKQQDPAASRRFLLSRGLWLIILELTLVNFGIWFNIHFNMLMLQVIAAIGAGLILLGLLIRVPLRILVLIGGIILFGHDLLLTLPQPSNPTLKFLSSLLFVPGLFPVSPNFTVFIAYPIIPWFGMMLLGFAGGPLFLLPDEKRKKTFLRIAGAALLLFVVLRYSNLYGNPLPWAPQKNFLYTFLSFINVNKYPPSLLYTLITLGILFLILAAVDGKDSRVIRIFSVYGRTPLFYYLIHWYIFHTIMLIMVFAQGFHAKDMVFGPFQFGRPAAGSGVSLPVLYIIWISVMILLYPLCKRYGDYKLAHPEIRWLRYL